MKNEQRSTETRTGILNAASECFAEDGYPETGVAEICRRAGVSKGAFYYHFDSKEAVLLEILNSWLATLEQTLETVASGANDIPGSLLSMTGMMQSVLETDRKQIALFLELWTQAGRNEKVRRAALEPYRKYHQILKEFIRRGVAEGTLEPVDPVSGAQVLLSLSSGLFLQALLDPDAADWGRVLRDSLQILLDGLKRR